jgi:hypothetical protein
MLDLEPATRTLANVVAGVRDGPLTAATPCRDVTVGALLDHVDSFSMAFTAGAVGATAAQNPDGMPGLFGPPVAVPVGSSLLDRVIGLTGRDPRWPSGANGG